MNKITLIICAFLGFVINTFSQSFTPFTYQTPIYGSHAVNDVKWINATRFIAVGDAGAMLLSNNDGNTWQRIQPFTQQTFRKVFVKDSLTLFAIASHDYGLGECYKSIDGGYTWTLIHDNANSSFRDIHFPNDTVGYIVSYYGKITKTTDGGVTWNESGINTILGTYLNAIHFLNSDTGFVGKGTTSAPLFRTDNGGLTWTQVYGYLGQDCYTIQFLNDTIGYIGAYNGKIHCTTNGGLTWAQQTNLTTYEEVYGVAFSSLTKGVAVSNNYVYRTNNGTTWSSPFLSGFNFRSCAYSPSGTLILGDSYGGLHRASNNGTSYTNVNTQSGIQDYRRIHFTSAQTAWVVGDGVNVLRTMNGGNTWTKFSNAPYCNTVFDMQALSSNKIIYVTDQGNVISTNNGGTSFSTINLSTTEWLNTLSFPTSSIGYIFGNSGLAFKTSNGGSTYTALNTGITVNHIETHFPSANTGYVVSSWGELKKTSDGGSTWSSLNPSGMSYIKKVFFRNDNYGFFVNDAGIAFRTTDGGVNITQVGQTCIEKPFDMQFINDSTGFVVGSYVNATCDISFTTDSGSTWNSIILPFAYSGWGIHAFDTAHIYLVGQNQTIIRIGTGGVITDVTHTMSHLDAFSISPNPAQNLTRISSNERIEQLRIFDLAGRELPVDTEKVKGGHEAIIHTESLHHGIYLVQINQNATKKLIIE